MPRKKLGELLVQAGVITPAQLNRALGEQSRWNTPLGRILVDLGLVTEEKLVKALSYQTNLPIADLDRLEISQQVLDFVPGEFCQEHGVLPFAEDSSGRFLDVAMVEPLDLDVIETLRVITEHNIRSYFATYSAMTRALLKYHGLALKTLDGPAPVFAAGLDAREISPSGYHLAAAAGAPVREVGTHTLETEAMGATQIPAGPTDAISSRVAALERDIVGLTRKLEEAVRGQPPTDQMARLGQSLKNLAAAVTELRGAATRTQETIARLTDRMERAEALQERDERVLKKLLGLLVSKGLASSDELRRLLERP